MLGKLWVCKKMIINDRFRRIYDKTSVTSTNERCCHDMRFESCKCVKNTFVAGVPPRTPLPSAPQTGYLDLGEKRERWGTEGKGREGRAGGKGGEGKGWTRSQVKILLATAMVHSFRTRFWKPFNWDTVHPLAAFFTKLVVFALFWKAVFWESGESSFFICCILGYDNNWQVSCRKFTNDAQLRVGAKRVQRNDAIRKI